MGIEQTILDKYPELIGYEELSQILGPTVASLRNRFIAPTSTLDKTIAESRVWLGRRVYFQTKVVAKALALTIEQDPRNQGNGKVEDLTRLVMTGRGWS